MNIADKVTIITQRKRNKSILLLMGIYIVCVCVCVSVFVGFCVYYRNSKYNGLYIYPASSGWVQHQMFSKKTKVF